MDANAHALSLAGRHVLLAEDDALVALDLASAFETEGAIVLGPFSRVAEALDCIGSGIAIDSAVLDIDLGGEAVFPVAIALRERGIPFVFASGRAGHDGLPRAFAHVPCWGKPYRARAIAATRSAGGSSAMKWRAR